MDGHYFGGSCRCPAVAVSKEYNNISALCCKRNGADFSFSARLTQFIRKKTRIFAINAEIYIPSAEYTPEIKNNYYIIKGIKRMIYCISDVHGLPLKKLKELLKKGGFGTNKDDFLFILGDVIDRGQPYGGIDILKWLLSQPNVQLLLGNHEAMMLACKWILNTVTDSSLARVTAEDMDLLANWMANGATPTLWALKKLAHHRPDIAHDIMDYLEDCPLCETVNVAGRDFILTHAGLGNFSPTKKLWDYTPEELLLHRPELTDVYYKNATVIFGHTPTAYWGSQYSGSPIYTPSWICINTGNTPTLLRLDDMAEFRLE